MNDSTSISKQDEAAQIRDNNSVIAAADALATEKWKKECEWKERELALSERRVDIEECKRGQSFWATPLVLAILAATIAASGNAIVAFINAQQSRALENRSAESARILEVLRAPSSNEAATNLQFLLDTGLVYSEDRVLSLNKYLKNRSNGEGARLAAALNWGPDPSQALVSLGLGAYAMGAYCGIQGIQGIRKHTDNSQAITRHMDKSGPDPLGPDPCAWGKLLRPHQEPEDSVAPKSPPPD